MGKPEGKATCEAGRLHIKAEYCCQRPTYVYPVAICISLTDSNKDNYCGPNEVAMAFCLVEKN